MVHHKVRESCSNLMLISTTETSKERLMAMELYNFFNKNLFIQVR